MSELAFVFLDDDTSLRRVVDSVQAAVDSQGLAWHLFHVLVRSGGAYGCIRLNHLSAALEGWRQEPEREWSMSTLVTEFPMEACVALSVDQVRDGTLRAAQAPFVVIEQGGGPLRLYPGQSQRRIVRTDAVGWWRLVGLRMAELGHAPQWPDRLPDTVRFERVMSARPETTLREIAQRLTDHGPGMQATLGVLAGDETWAVLTTQELLQRIGREYPDAGPGSQVGAFVDADLDKMESVQRSRAPWGLVKALLARSPQARLLVVEAGRPMAVLCHRSTSVRSVAPGRGGGWSRFLSEAAGIQPEARDRGRVVNSWFANRQRQHIPHTFALGANQAYLLGVSIGTPSGRSHAASEQNPLDAKLVNYVLGRGARLTVRLDSDQLIVLDREQQVELSPAGTARDGYLRIVTPVQTGTAVLRLAVYLENNLVQSHRICVRVAPREGRMPEGAGDGWWSECEYALSLDLRGLDSLESRRVCLWIGEDGRDVRRVGASVASGLGLGPALTVNTRLIEESLHRYRELLLQSCLRYDGESLTYLYLSDHTPRSPDVYDRAIRELAELGQTLYSRVLGGAGRPVADSLRGVERTEGRPLVVQIARLNLDAVFPWAVLYDRPLRYHPTRNVVCRRFMPGEACRLSCPHEGDPNVICPYGFWGFRYIIEQPLRPSNARTPVITRLVVRDRPRIAMLYGSGLGMTDYHRRRLDVVAGARADCVVLDTAAGLLDEMMMGPTVAYLYCHGGNTPYRQWLVIGDDDPLLAVHLGDELSAAWRSLAERGGSPPLVILNACSSGRYSPSTLLSFVHRFGGLGAAGVIGTEIPIHEYLGRAFGEFFMARLLNGEPVGKIVYDFRHELLKRSNVLGLAYAPYCYASLRLTKESA